MPDRVYCLLAALACLAALVFMTYVLFGAGRPQLFKNWAEIRDGWRDSRSDAGECVLFLLAFAKFLRGPLFLTFLVVTLPPLISIGTAVCGLDVEELRIVHAIVKDVLDFLREVCLR